MRRSGGRLMLWIMRGLYRRTTFKVRRLGVLSRTGTARAREQPGKQLTLQARAPGTDGGRLD